MTIKIRKRIKSKRKIKRRNRLLVEGTALHADKQRGGGAEKGDGAWF